MTHQLQYLKDADLIVVLKEGKVQETGTFEHLAKNGLDFSSLLTLEEEEEKEEEEDIFSEEDIILMKGRDPGWNHLNKSDQFTKDSRKGLFIISKYIHPYILVKIVILPSVAATTCWGPSHVSNNMV